MKSSAQVRFSTGGAVSGCHTRRGTRRVVRRGRFRRKAGPSVGATAPPVRTTRSYPGMSRPRRTRHHDSRTSCDGRSGRQKTAPCAPCATSHVIMPPGTGFHCAASHCSGGRAWACGAPLRGGVSHEAKGWGGARRSGVGRLGPPPPGYCQVDVKLVDRPPRYCARVRREPAILGTRNGYQLQLDNTQPGTADASEPATEHHAQRPQDHAIHHASDSSRGHGRLLCVGRAA